MFKGLSRNDWLLFAGFSAFILLMPIILQPIGAAYPALMQKMCIFAIFAIGFNILFGLTGYLSFGHAAFLGVGSYAAVWSFKLFTMNILPALAMSLYPPEVRIAIVIDNFSPHLTTTRDDRVGRWAAANNVEIAYTPFYGSWLNRIEAQFTALRYFTLDGTDHQTHREQASMIRRYEAPQVLCRSHAGCGSGVMAA